MIINRDFIVSKHTLKRKRAFEITEIPRKRLKTKCKKNIQKTKVTFPQQRCICDDCILFEEQCGFQKYLAKIRLQFTNDLNVQQRTNLIGGWVVWLHFKKRWQEKKWTENSKDDEKYPKNYKIRIPGINGFGEYTVCTKYVQYLFQIGRKKMKTILTNVWKSRKNSNIFYTEPWITEVADWIFKELPLSQEHYVS